MLADAEGGWALRPDVGGVGEERARVKRFPDRSLSPARFNVRLMCWLWLGVRSIKISAEGRWPLWSSRYNWPMRTP